MKLIVVGGSDLSLRLDYINRIYSFHNVKLFGLDKNENIIHKEGYFYSSNYIVMFWRLLSICLFSKPDCIHSFDTKPNVLIVVLSFLFKNIKFIKTHTGLGKYFSKGNKHVYIKKILLWFFRLNSKRIDSVVQNERDYRLFKFLGITNLHLIRSSCIVIAQKDSCVYMDQDKKYLKVFMASRLIVEKGPLDFLKIVSEYNMKYGQNKVMFYLIGPVDDYEIMSEIRKCNYENFTYLDNVNSLSTKLHNFDICIFLSKYAEGVPRILLESMRSHLPIIAYDNVGTSDCLEDSYNGYLLRSGDVLNAVIKLNKLVTDSELRYMFGMNSFLLVKKKFEMNLITNKYLDLYEKYSKS